MDKKSAQETILSKQQSPGLKWTASEFVDHQKTILWYLALLGGVALLSGVLYLATRDVLSSIAIVIAGILFAILAGRKPRVLSYEINNKGLTIDKKFYPYSLFKSFSLFQEGAIGAISFMPLRRFMPELSIHFSPDMAGKIIDDLSLHLPNEEYVENPIDRFAKKIRF